MLYERLSTFIKRVYNEIARIRPAEYVCPWPNIAFSHMQPKTPVEVFATGISARAATRCLLNCRQTGSAR
jgi:hypothetical protein